MSIYRVRLEPLAPFYVAPHGRARKSGALVHSDTLHGALVAVAALTGSPLLDRAPELRLSSLFPFWRDLFLYPKPFFHRPGQQPEGDVKGRKRWKSVSLLSEKLLATWLRGAAVPEAEIRVLPGGAAVLASELEGRPAPPDALVVEEFSTAVVIDRAGGATTPFDRRGLRVNTGKGCGAWFFVELEKGHLPSFQRLVQELGEQGLGGERSVGYGRFDLLGIEEWTDRTALFGTADAPDFFSLSLYLPTRDEVDRGVLDAPAAYDCALRGGWIHGPGGSDQRKRSLRMCVEGSAFPAVAPRHGDMRDARPAAFTAHPVWRSGLAFALPCHLPKEAPHDP